MNSNKTKKIWFNRNFHACLKVNTVCSLWKPIDFLDNRPKNVLYFPSYVYVQ